MNEIPPQSQTRKAGTETVLERLYDREGLRRLSLIQRILFQKLRRSEINQLKALHDDRVRGSQLKFVDNLMTLSGDVGQAEPDRADAESDSERGSDND